MIRLEDMIGVKLRPGSSPLDCLMAVVAVAADQYGKEALATDNPTKRRKLSEKPPVNDSSLILRLKINNEYDGRKNKAKYEWASNKQNNPTFPLPKDSMKHSLIVAVAEKQPAIAPPETPPKNTESPMLNKRKADSTRDLRGKKQRKMSPAAKAAALPEGFEECIREMGGSESKLVIQKALFKTDVSGKHCRFAVPASQVQNEFLSTEEKATLSTHNGKSCSEISVRMIEPGLRKTDMKLRKWVMEKPNGGKASCIYVLVNKWNEIVSRNGLKEGETVQLWSFRVDSGSLCFALIRV